jgi:hypothetical protein
MRSLLLFVGLVLGVYGLLPISISGALQEPNPNDWLIFAFGVWMIAIVLLLD